MLDAVTMSITLEIFGFVSHSHFISRKDFSMAQKLFQNLFARNATSGNRKPFSQRAALRVETLEERAVPAILTVDQGLNVKPNADYETIQEAIDNANPGDVIRVYDGTYDETLEITTDNLRILNKSGAATVIQPSAIGTDDAIVDIRGATGVLFKGFYIDGSVVTGAAGQSDFDAAIRVVGEGSATIRGNNISGLFDADGYANPNGFGIHVGDPGDGNGTAKIIDNTITDYFKDGILVEAVDGGTSRAVARWNTIIGVGPTDVVPAGQLGIEADGFDGTVIFRARWNTIKGNDNSLPTSDGFFASGILFTDFDAADKGYAIRNWVQENQAGITSGTKRLDPFVTPVDGSQIKIFHNDVTNNVADGILLLDTNNSKIIGNTSTNNGQVFSTNDVTVDFAGFAAGTILTNQIPGITVDAFGGSGDAMIFDTNNPTGGDTDLGFTDQGNALIISEDGDTSDPDDNAGGGDLKFTFDSEVTVNQITLLDIDSGETAKVKLFDEHGSLIATFDSASLGDNTVETIDINVDGVASMIVWLSGSGAVSGFEYTEQIAEEGFGGGITLFDSSNNLIKGNFASENGLDGIFIFGGSGNIVRFDAANNNFFDGIFLYGTTGNIVEANEVSSNGNNGISLVDADDNTIRLNFSLENNEEFGIDVDADSTGNIIEDNWVFGDNDVVSGAAGTSTEAEVAEDEVLGVVDALVDDYIDEE